MAIIAALARQWQPFASPTLDRSGMSWSHVNGASSRIWVPAARRPDTARRGAKARGRLDAEPPPGHPRLMGLLKWPAPDLPRERTNREWVQHRFPQCDRSALCSGAEPTLRSRRNSPAMRGGNGSVTTSEIPSRSLPPMRFSVGSSFCCMCFSGGHAAPSEACVGRTPPDARGSGTLRPRVETLEIFADGTRPTWARRS